MTECDKWRADRLLEVIASAKRDIMTVRQGYIASSGTYKDINEKLKAITKELSSIYREVYAMSEDN